MAGLVALNRDAILERIRQGHRLTDIASDLGLSSHAAIINALQKDPEYSASREAGVEARMEGREREMEGANDSVTVARTRELLSHARWRAEREFPARWGATGKLQVEQGLSARDQQLLSDASQLLHKLQEKEISGETATKPIAAAQDEEIIEGTLLNNSQGTDK